MMLVIGRFLLALLVGWVSIGVYITVYHGEQTLGKLATVLIFSTCTMFIVLSLIGSGKGRT